MSALLKARAERVPPRPDLLVCTPQSWNRPDQVRKAAALCDKLTPGNNHRQEEDMEKENMAGGECWRGR